MKSKKDVFPRKQGEFNTFQITFVAIVVLNAIAWGISSAALAIVTAAQDVFTPAFAKGIDKANRTHVDVVAKNDATKAYKGALRPFIKVWIYGNTMMTNEQIASTGLELHATERSRIPAPATWPKISVEKGAANAILLVFEQETFEPGTRKKGKPAGVARCNFVYSIGTLPAGPLECTHNISKTRSPLKLYFDPSYSGQKVYCFAQWVNAKDEGGPWTQMFVFVIP